MLLVDTNVLVDVLENDALWVEWSMRQLNTQSQVHELVINPVIYAELSLTFKVVEAPDKTLDDIGLRICEILRSTLFLAGKAFVCYRCGVGKITCWVISSWVLRRSAALPGAYPRRSPLPQITFPVCL